MKLSIAKLKEYFSIKIFIASLIAACILATTVYAVSEDASKSVTIKCDGNEISFQTTKYYVKDILEEKGISVGTFDEVVPPVDTVIKKSTEIVIKRAVPVKITVDSKETFYMTYKDTVQELFDSAEISLGDKDIITGASLGDNIISDMNIKVLRVGERVESVSKTVNYDVERKDSNSIYVGNEQVKQAGKNGKITKKYKVVCQNGVEVSRELISSKVVKEPVTEIILVGTKQKPTLKKSDKSTKTSNSSSSKSSSSKNTGSSTATSGNADFNYSKVLNMRATAYTSSFADTGKSPGDSGFGLTRTGTVAKKGTVAVDPSVIPLGSRLYVACPGAGQDYGYAVAEDTGGSIKGNIIDLFYENTADLNTWFTKNVVVYVLK